MTVELDSKSTCEESIGIDGGGSVGSTKAETGFTVTGSISRETEG